MGKRIRKCSRNCQSHIFVLKPISQNSKLIYRVKLILCPEEDQYPIYPFFNRDGKFYTPAFILKQFQKKYQQDDSKHQANHFKNACDHKSKSDIYIPKPKSKSMYCHVCEKHYKQYIHHIRNKDHKKQASKNKWSHYIRELILLYTPKVARQFQSKSNVSEPEISYQYEGESKMQSKNPSTIINKNSDSDFSSSQSVKIVGCIQKPSKNATDWIVIDD